MAWNTLDCVWQKVGTFLDFCLIVSLFLIRPDPSRVALRQDRHQGDPRHAALRPLPGQGQGRHGQLEQQATRRQRQQGRQQGLAHEL